MLPLPRIALAALLLLMFPTSAEALCSYKGVDNASTTIRQEYADARWVVRARVLGARDGVIKADEPEAGSPWTLYRLQVVHRYKGHPPQPMSFFTMRNSGGFYMDRRWAGHDIGGEYLLFLNPVTFYRGQPRAQRGAAFVNYSCGQSRPWPEVSTATRRLLASLSGRR